MNKRIAWGTMLTMILVSMMALTISVNIAKAAYDPAFDLYPVGNPDGKIDGRDLAIFAKSFGTYEGGPNWNPAADLNGDKKIDGKDLVIFAKHFGSMV